MADLFSLCGVIRFEDRQNQAQFAKKATAIAYNGRPSVHKGLLQRYGAGSGAARGRSGAPPSQMTKNLMNQYKSYRDNSSFGGGGNSSSTEPSREEKVSLKET